MRINKNINKILDYVVNIKYIAIYLKNIENINAMNLSNIQTFYIYTHSNSPIK